MLKLPGVEGARAPVLTWFSHLQYGICLLALDIYHMGFTPGRRIFSQIALSMVFYCRPKRASTLR